MRRFEGGTIPHRFVLVLRVYPDLQGMRGWWVVRLASAVFPQRYVRRIRKYPGFEQGGSLVGILFLVYILIKVSFQSKVAPEYDMSICFAVSDRIH